MEIIKIAVDFKDKEYGNALGKALAQEGKGYQVTIEDCGQLHSERIALDAHFIITDSEDIQAPYSERIKDYENKVIILKEFMRVSSLLALVGDKYRQVYGGRRFDRMGRECELILVTGYPGGSGVTSVSYGLAQEYSRYYDKRICILSFELFPQAEEEEAFYEGTLLRRLLCLLEKDEGAAFDGRIYFKRDINGIYVPAYDWGINPLLELDSRSLHNFIGRVFETGMFDCIIADAPPERGVHFSMLMEEADKIYMVEKGNMEGEPAKKFMSYYGLKEDGEFGYKTVWISNFSLDTENSREEDMKEQEGREETGIKTEGKKIYIEWDDNSFIGGKVRIDGAFGLGIKECALFLSQGNWRIGESN